MRPLPRPDLPPGPHRDLVDALHDLHHRDGWPSLRVLPATPASPTPPSPRPSPPRPSRPGARSSSSSRPSTATQPSSTTSGSPPPRPPTGRVRARPGSPAARPSSPPYAATSRPAPACSSSPARPAWARRPWSRRRSWALTCSPPPATASPCRQRCPCCRLPTACAACTRPMEASGSARPSPPARRTSHPPWPRCSPRSGREQPMHRWEPTTDSCCSRRSARRFVPWSGSAPSRSCSRTSTGPMPPLSTCWSTCSGGAHRRLSWGPGVRATTRPRSPATTGSRGYAANTPPRCSSSVLSPWKRRRSSFGCSVETLQDRVDRIHTRSQGQPLFTEQLAAHLDDVPGLPRPARRPARPEARRAVRDRLGRGAHARRRRAVPVAVAARRGNWVVSRRADDAATDPAESAA